MPILSFQPAEPGDDNPDYDDTGCQCPPSDNQYLLEIDEGQAVLIHATCGKPPSYKWGDFQDLIVMNPIPVTVEWESDCTGWHYETSCDCDSWVNVTASSVPEDVRAQALELTRKHVQERNGGWGASPLPFWPRLHRLDRPQHPERTPMTEHECSCGLRSPEDFDGPAEDCPEHGNPQVLGYCPLSQYETWRDENDRLREERDEARQQCTEQEQQHAFAMEEARGRLAQADKAYAQLLTDRNRLREELAAYRQGAVGTRQDEEA